MEKKRSKNSNSETRIFCWWIQLGYSGNSNPWYIFAGIGLAERAMPQQNGDGSETTSFCSLSHWIPHTSYNIICLHPSSVL